MGRWEKGEWGSLQASQAPPTGEQYFCQDGTKPDAYDLILMDVQMPVMDGLEATRRIRSMRNDYFKKVPIVAMTANAFEEDRKAALDAGMNEHVAKPIDVEKLKKVFHAYFILHSNDYLMYLISVYVLLLSLNLYSKHHFNSCIVFHKAYTTNDLSQSLEP